MKARKPVCWLGGVLLLVGLYGPAGAQARKEFEVVSIRPENPRGSSRPSSKVTPGRFDMVGVRPWELVARAFGIEQLLRVVAPDWTKRERFAIRAVMSGATERDIPEMLKTLLKERFSLKTHVEQRPFPVYELVVLPSGPTFREVAAADGLGTLFTSLSSAPAIYDVTSGLPGDQVRTIAAADGGGLYHITSRTSYVERFVEPNGARQIDAARITMAEFRGVLGPSLDRQVVDKTGLTGIYELKTLLPPARLSPTMERLLGDRLDTTPSGISMSRALKELGLKLEPKNTPVDFIVIDKIERPSTD